MSGSPAARLKQLLPYAARAPSPRNSQPWRFDADDKRICLYADLSRRARGTDPQARDLYLSVGCALENLLVAAAHFGLRGEVDYFPMSEDDPLVAQIWLTPDREAHRDPLFAAIARRHTEDASADGDALSAGVLGALRSARGDSSLALLLTQDAPVRRAVEAMLARAGSLAHASAPYLEAVAYCPPQRNRAAFTGVPAFGLISAERDGRLAQVKAGRLLERIALKAALLGLALQPLSLLLEFPEPAAALARLFQAGGVPLAPFRIGVRTGAAAPSPRRPLAELLHNAIHHGERG